MKVAAEHGAACSFQVSPFDVTLCRNAAADFEEVTGSDGTNKEALGEVSSWMNSC